MENDYILSQYNIKPEKFVRNDFSVLLPIWVCYVRSYNRWFFQSISFKQERHIDF